MRFLLFPLLLAGCSGIDRHVEGWPTLQVSYYEQGFWELQSTCRPYMPWWQKALGYFYVGCALVELDKGTCRIYHLKDAPPAVLHHEEEHCQGGSHDESFQEYFDKWKKSNILPI